MNAREQLEEIAGWLGDEEESLSFGLRNAYDALRLYDYAKARPELWHGFVTEWDAADRIAALGYDPMETEEAAKGREVEETGAAAAHDALLNLNLQGKQMKLMALKSHLLISVVWWLLASLSGILYLNKPHLYFLVAGSFASLVALLHITSGLLTLKR